MNAPEQGSDDQDAPLEHSCRADAGIHGFAPLTHPPSSLKESRPGDSLLHEGIITSEEYRSAVGQQDQTDHSIWSALRDAVRLILPSAAGHSDSGDVSAVVRDATLEPAGHRLTVMPENAGSVPGFVSNLFENTIQWGGTDIHLDPEAAGVRIRIRIDGQLHDVGSLPIEMARHVRSRIKILAGMDILEKTGPQDGHICLDTDAGRRDFRVATLLTGLGERMVIRFHQAADQGLVLDALGLDPDQTSAVRGLLARPQGLVLVAGPVGSGKTTTLYACLRAVAHPMRSLITIEDPIEYRLDGICQVEVHPQLGLSFAHGLRAILRQDADVVAVGEIRDRDTARVVSRAAAAGALVLSAVHAASGAAVLRSLANYRVSPHRIAESMAGIIVQRLLRTLCSVCKRPSESKAKSFELLSSWELSREELERATFFEPVGCPLCLGTGYRGRTGVFEVIEIDELDTANASKIDWPLVLTKGPHCKLQVAAGRKVARGITTVEEAARVLSLRMHR